MGGLIDFSLNDVGDIFKDLREAITGEAITDPNKKAEIELKIRKLEQALMLGQIEINKAEAQSKSIFVAGWRPSIGWICSFAIAYQFIITPTIEWACKLYGLDIVPPTIDSNALFNLVLAMLGIGGMRTYEKLKGVDTRKISPIKPPKEFWKK